jgi:HlyD family secretion protein
MVVQSDNRVKRVPIRTGERGSGLVQLVSGPPEGAPVVENAAGLLLDGDAVRPVEGAVAIAAAGPRR